MLFRDNIHLIQKHMIALYIKTGCPYCAKVVAVLDANAISYEEKNIADERVLEELVTKGGLRQVPYMVDGEIAMYESDDIIAYIEKTYGVEGSGKLHVHTSGETCGGSTGSGSCPV